jgi:UDP-glucose 4-epimerase
VTGASGTLGFNIVQQLSAKHPDVQICLFVRTPRPDLFEGSSNVVQKTIDMMDTTNLIKGVLELQPEAIIHCAASGVRPAAISYFDLIELNVSATMHLFEASCELKRCHFINISTGLVYGSQQMPCKEDDPTNTLHPYGASKAAADFLLLAGAERLGRHVTIIRPFSFTGLRDGGDRLFPSLLRAAHEGRSFDMSPATQVRDFCAVQDVVEAILLILEGAEHSNRGIFNVGSGLSISLGCLVDSILKQLDLEVRIVPGAKPFQPQEPTNLVADISRMRSLGWEPRTNLAYAVWQLAKVQCPRLSLREPRNTVSV